MSGISVSSLSQIDTHYVTISVQSASAILKRMKFTGISVIKAPDAEQRSSVALIISNELTMTTAEGDTYPGAALQPKQARVLAYRILAIAAEIEAEAN
jgi:hypothetical protein